MDRVFPVERRIVKALRPVLARAAGVPMPEDDVFDAVERLHAELDEVRALLTGPEASVRLVLTPEEVVLAEARRSLTTLSLFGYRVDGVVANRVFPAEGADAVAGRLGGGAGRGARAGGGVVRRRCRCGGRRTAPSEPVGRATRSRTSAARRTAATTRSPYRRRRSRCGSPGRSDGRAAATAAAVRRPRRRRPGAGTATSSW